MTDALKLRHRAVKYYNITYLPDSYVNWAKYT